jgi:hypothetical protein
MRVALPHSGGFAEFRDRMMRGDIVAARKAMVFITGPDGSRRLEGDFIDKVTAAVIRQMLVSWDLGLPTPAQVHTAELWDGILNQVDEDDTDALDAAVGPWVERVMRTARGSGPVFTHKASGVKVTVAEQDIPALTASPDFTREEADGDPKTGSARTAITSPASPEPDGQEAATSTTPTSS